VKVLLVEDQELNIDMIARRLRRRGFSVDVATDGETALSKSCGEDYDLVLLDIALPDISGLEVASRMKSDDRTRDVPVIALTAHALKGDRDRAIAAGCDAYATKPIDFEGLMTQISQLVQEEGSTNGGRI
jgi:CheY-like chemotaxis protein